MAFHVRNPATEARVRELARKKGVGLTEAIDLAVSDVLRREADETERRLEALTRLRERFRGYPRTGLKADKAFLDSLYEDGDEPR